ncbi:MAG: TetR/AcrR family transcriptional regulator [Planctomycetota bacterium]
MQGTDQSAATDPPPPPCRIDGRRQRSLRTRQAIIEAFIGLLRENPQVPTVAQIAKCAGCSARSVFERFADRQELGLATIDHVIGLGLSTPVGDRADADRQLRLRFQVETRARICENWLPLWRVLMRHQDEGDAVKARIQMVREAVLARLKLMYRPELSVLSEAERTHMLIALEALTDFETWERMRRQHGLSFEAACEVWISMIDRLLPPTPSAS